MRALLALASTQTRGIARNTVVERCCNRADILGQETAAVVHSQNRTIGIRGTGQGRSAASRQNRADSVVSPAHAKERQSAARSENHLRAAIAARFSGRTAVWKRKGRSNRLQPERQCRPDF